jgi:hypothetical protein
MTIVAPGPITGGVKKPRPEFWDHAIIPFDPSARHFSHAKSEHSLTGGDDDVSA